MEFQDKVLKCIDCSADFVFTAGEQKFFHEKQFSNEPKRCKNCKTKIKRVSVFNPAPAGRNSSRIDTRVTCSRCGKHTTVPFHPTQGRPVLCHDCFQRKRTASSA
ncbi:MAG: zinc-ribbon domain containing protein [Terriglobales bacterium]